MLYYYATPFFFGLGFPKERFAMGLFYDGVWEGDKYLLS
jgi:hypothetical protein